MIIRDKDSSYVPEVNSIEMFGYRHYFRGEYYSIIDGSAVVNYIKRKQTCQE